MEQKSVEKYNEKFTKAVNKLADQLSINTDMERVHRMVIAALYVNRADYKQWYLYEVADELGIPVRDWDIDRGVAPPIVTSVE